MIKSFSDLQAWQEAHKFSLMIYKSTANFPRTEVFGLTDQLRRASVSITSNIAEGFGRCSDNDREHFYTIASASFGEVKSQLYLARDLSYLKNDEFKELFDQADLAHKLLNGLLRTHRSRKLNK